MPGVTAIVAVGVAAVGVGASIDANKATKRQRKRVGEATVKAEQDSDAADAKALVDAEDRRRNLVVRNSKSGRASTFSNESNELG